MLGNWSLGEYFKPEQLKYFFGFLTDELGIDPSKLYVTVFAGDKKAGIERDEESARIWQELFATKSIDAQIVDIGSEEHGGEIGMQSGRIFYYDASKNWWSRAGRPEAMPVGEPGGPQIVKSFLILVVSTIRLTVNTAIQIVIVADLWRLATQSLCNISNVGMGALMNCQKKCRLWWGAGADDRCGLG